MQMRMYFAMDNDLINPINGLNLIMYRFIIRNSSDLIYYSLNQKQYHLGL